VVTIKPNIDTARARHSSPLTNTALAPVVNTLGGGSHVIVLLNIWAS